MPFAKPPQDGLDAIATKVLDQFRRSDSHPIPSVKGLTFAQIERRAHEVGQRIAAQLTAEALANAAGEQASSADCPTCTTACRVTRKERPMTTLDGPLEYLEPAAYCVVCRRDFFPSASSTGSE